MKNKTKRIIGNGMLTVPVIAVFGSMIYFLGWDSLIVIGVLTVFCIYLYIANKFSNTPKDNS